MNSLHTASRWCAASAALFSLGLALSAAQTPAKPMAKPASAAVKNTYPPLLVKSGGELFRQDCSFCHGRDAAGGETGPDLTRSKLVTGDVKGDKIGRVVLNGRVEKGMPHFDYSDKQIASVVAFIHNQKDNAPKRIGGRKGVEVADLQTGNTDAGKQYFNGAGGCATCHSPTGDLAGLATRYKGLELEQQMLYPKKAKSKVTVTPGSGQAITGTLSYLDEFTVGLIDATGVYHSWRISDVQYKVDAPVNAHIEQLPKYTDEDIHDLMAYLQTLR
jgi:cytochrome c oxidase cbb3-type subunit 3